MQIFVACVRTSFGASSSLGSDSTGSHGIRQTTAGDLTGAYCSTGGGLPTAKPNTDEAMEIMLNENRCTHATKSTVPHTHTHTLPRD